MLARTFEPQMIIGGTALKPADLIAPGHIRLPDGDTDALVIGEIDNTVTPRVQAYVAVSFVRRHIGLTWAGIGRAAWPGCVATLCAASGIAAVMSMLGFRTMLTFGETLVAMLAAGLGWLAGLWLGGHPLFGEIRGLCGRVLRWA